MRDAPFQGGRRGRSLARVAYLGALALQGISDVLCLWRDYLVPRAQPPENKVSRMPRERKKMITQTEVNTAFEMGQQRMFDLDDLLDEGVLEHAELSGMMMGALRVHARRCHQTLLSTAIELAEMIRENSDDDE